VVACMVMTPVLTVYSDALGAFGAWAVLTQVYGVPSTEYWHYTSLFLVTLDPLNGLLKAACFGGAIGLISCYKGFSCAPGAAGVGRAATSAFVASFVAIVAINLLLVEFMNALTVWIYGGLPRVL
jgi:phospholipid/cholesterol/gamma-HCH transport system permease protein